MIFKWSTQSSFNEINIYVDSKILISVFFFFHDESYFLISFSKFFAFLWSSNIVTSLYNLISIVSRFDLKSTAFLIRRWLILNTNSIGDFRFRKWLDENFDFDRILLVRRNALSRQLRRLFHDISFLFDNSFFFHIRSMCSIEHA